MTKADKKKAKKKKKGAMALDDDPFVTGPSQPVEETPSEGRPIETPAEVETPADERPVDERPVEEEPTQAPAEIGRSISQDESAPSTKGKKNKKKKKALQSLADDVPTSEPMPSVQPSEVSQTETPGEPAVVVPESGMGDLPLGEEGTYIPPSEQEIATPLEEKANDSKDKIETSPTFQPDQPPVQDQPAVLVSEPTDAIDSGPVESSSRDAPQDDIALPVSGKKAKKKKKKKGSISEGSGSTTPAIPDEQGSTPVEVPEARKETASEDLVSADLKKGEDEKGAQSLDGKFFFPSRLKSRLRCSAATDIFL
ncbi:hypothetical protein IMZ48_09120 [Candidatus Bathyarchaeota archaeon]|nr:hypothetical protein [Candidatus Bathyarchaeota archaeon]